MVGGVLVGFGEIRNISEFAKSVIDGLSRNSNLISHLLLSTASQPHIKHLLLSFGFGVSGFGFFLFCLSETTVVLVVPLSFFDAD